MARTEKDMTKAARAAKELFDQTTLKPAVKRYKASEGPRPKVEVARHKADRNSNKVRTWDED